ncbi:ester cyclase [Solitalea sp. MAHUQ-68]|uniref:Ester cyclase n=1 Tax=Solitalea agri TaxID=2953739 RepID=A0A9X2F1E0_9SPHI|nr:ester cyclase [Solitalea agri]MCO4292365.1 ester cyclase [Solitalea agri]
MSIESNKEIVIRFNKEFLQNGNTEVLTELVDEHFVNHTIPSNMPNNVSGLIQFVGILHKGFPDLSIQIEEQIAENDMVATRKTITATHLGEIMGRQPTGKKVTIKVMDMVRLKNGKYIDHWGINDMMQVIQSL